MLAVLAFLLVATVEKQVPTDRQIAAHIQQSIQDSLHPGYVSVTISRRTRVSTVISQVEITLGRFNVTELPFSAPPAPAGAAVVPAVPEPGPQYRIKQAHITCENFTIQALPVRKLELFGHEVRISKAGVDAGYLDITAAERVEGVMDIAEAGLTALLGVQPNLPIKEPTARLTTGECEVSGETPWAIGVPVAVAGPLVAANGAVFSLVNPQLRVVTAPIPSLVGDRVFKDINPLVDINTLLQFPVPLTVTRTVVTQGKLRVEGTIDFPKPM
jgi:hypothetical protein